MKHDFVQGILGQPGLKGEAGDPGPMVSSALTYVNTSIRNKKKKMRWQKFSSLNPNQNFLFLLKSCSGTHSH